MKLKNRKRWGKEVESRVPGGGSKNVAARTVRNGKGTGTEGKEEELSAMSKQSRSAVPRPPVFETKEEERAYLKFRLAQAFRIFGRLGYDEGVAGHITVRVRTPSLFLFHHSFTES